VRPLDHTQDADRIDWLRIAPFVALHVACLGVVWVGWSPVAVSVAVGLYLVRMFAITAFYHRYFSHRAFRTSRAVQFLFAVIGNSSAQRGPLWWAAHHRKHHRRSDTESDVHSPVARSMLESHVGWIVRQPNFATDQEQVRDLARFPELRWLNRFDSVAPLALGASLYALGELLAAWAPGLGTNGLQMLVWGFAISTTVLFHATFTINSLAHRYGSRRFATTDDSRNNAWLALITLGEGWHNNHHHYPHSTRQGFRWWELDITWLVLRGMQALGLVWELRPVPRELLRDRSRRSSGGQDR
jgi:stearoyl-CoA desaturase (delta-9 desaturase)